MINKKHIFNASVNSGNVKLLTKDESVALKRTLLEMTNDVDKVCRKYGLKIFMVGGSLLGAVRHGGFIPWDDDVDFGMLRKDYKKLIKIFDKELGDKYYLRCPNSAYPNGNRFMQIFKKGTVLQTVEGNTPLQPECVLMDIFPYDLAPDNLFIRLIKGIRCNLLMIIASSVTSYKYPNKEYKSMMMRTFSGCALFYAQLIVGFLFSWRKPEEWFNTVDNAIQYNKQSKYITSATGRKHYFGELFPKKVFLPLRETKFEELFLYAPADADTYLKRLYGNDYMTPPPENKRESHFIKYLKL